MCEERSAAAAVFVMIDASLLVSKALRARVVAVSTTRLITVVASGTPYPIVRLARGRTRIRYVDMT